jgi:hypothetical protein
MRLAPVTVKSRLAGKSERVGLPLGHRLPELHRLPDLHGGRPELKSVRRHGTIATVTLPAERIRDAG